MHADQLVSLRETVLAVYCHELEHNDLSSEIAQCESLSRYRVLQWSCLPGGIGDQKWPGRRAWRGLGDRIDPNYDHEQYSGNYGEVSLEVRFLDPRTAWPGLNALGRR